MIRESCSADIDAIMDIWLGENLTAHDFIPAQHWHSHHAGVRQAIQCAEVYVYEKNRRICGFMGLSGSFVAGLFVHHGFQRRGYGTELLSFAQKRHARLSLWVYEKNTVAATFYRKHGFMVCQQRKDHAVNCWEWEMVWRHSERETVQ